MSIAKQKRVATVRGTHGGPPGGHFLGRKRPQPQPQPFGGHILVPGRPQPQPQPLGGTYLPQAVVIATATATARRGGTVWIVGGRNRSLQSQPVRGTHFRSLAAATATATARGTNFGTQAAATATATATALGAHMGPQAVATVSATATARGVCRKPSTTAHRRGRLVGQ